MFCILCPKTSCSNNFNALWLTDKKKQFYLYQYIIIYFLPNNIFTSLCWTVHNFISSSDYSVICLLCSTYFFTFSEIILSAWWFFRKISLINRSKENGNRSFIDSYLSQRQTQLSPPMLKILHVIAVVINF